MTDSARILCVAGSPRPGGNSDQLLDACVTGVKSAGGVVDLLAVRDEAIALCEGCNVCVANGLCKIDDAMQGVYARIDDADAIIIASPVYFATVPALLKGFYDRCQPYWARTHRLGEERRAKRPGGLLLVRGGGDPYGFDAAIATTRSVLAVLQVELFAEVHVEGVDAPTDIQKHPEQLACARDLGAAIVAAVNATRQT